MSAVVHRFLDIFPLLSRHDDAPHGVAPAGVAPILCCPAHPARNRSHTRAYIGGVQHGAVDVVGSLDVTHLELDGSGSAYAAEADLRCRLHRWRLDGFLLRSGMRHYARQSAKGVPTHQLIVCSRIRCVVLATPAVCERRVSGHIFSTVTSCYEASHTVPMFREAAPARIRL